MYNEHDVRVNASFDTNILFRHRARQTWQEAPAALPAAEETPMIEPELADADGAVHGPEVGVGKRDVDAFNAMQCAISRQSVSIMLVAVGMPERA